jgi:hypothetical protein
MEKFCRTCAHEGLEFVGLYRAAAFSLNINKNITGSIRLKVSTNNLVLVYVGRA